MFAGDNGKVVYSFNTKTQKDFGDKFDIQQDSGEIYLKKPLDFEQQNGYSLTVVAQDQGPDSLPVTCRVQVQVNILPSPINISTMMCSLYAIVAMYFLNLSHKVIDQNDNKPSILVNSEGPSGHIAVQEHSDPDTFIAHISVSDKDGGRNGQVQDNN